MKLSNLAKAYKALSNEQRLRLFKMIYEWNKSGTAESQETACCSETDKAFTRACDCMDISRSTVSHHLKELQNAGLITSTRKGQVFSSIVNLETVQAIKSFLD